MNLKHWKDEHSDICFFCQYNENTHKKMQSPSEMKQLISEFEATNGRSNSLRRKFNELYGGAADIMDLEEMNIESDLEYEAVSEESEEDIHILLDPTAFGYSRNDEGNYIPLREDAPFLAARKSAITINSRGEDIYTTIAIVRPGQFLVHADRVFVKVLRTWQGDLLTDMLLQSLSELECRVKVWGYNELHDHTRSMEVVDLEF